MGTSEPQQAQRVPTCDADLDHCNSLISLEKAARVAFDSDLCNMLVW